MHLQKINITKRLLRDYPDISEKLELYQDKCADVLSSVFIDKKTTTDINAELLTKAISNAITIAVQPLYEKISKLEEQANQKKLPEKRYSRWKANTFNKLNALLSYVNEHSNKNMKLPSIIHLIITEIEDTYDVELNDYVDAYKSEFGLDENPYTLDVIHRYKDIRDMFTLTLDSIINRLHITADTDKIKTNNIFDELAAKITTN